MEGMNYLTSGDLAMWETYRKGANYCDYHKGGGKATTGIGLAAGLGGGALLLAIAGIWGINQASKARARGNEKAIEKLADLAIAERGSRESWQLAHTPTIQQYVDVRAGAGATASSSALAQAEASLLTNALMGKTMCCPQEVTLVSKEFCKCPTSNTCCG